MTPKEALIAARDLIADPNSWTRHYAATTQEGAPTDVSSPDAACWCAKGAILKTVLSEPHDLWFQTYDIFENALLRINNYEFISVPDFNDHHTHLEVLAVFERAIQEAP